MIKYYDLIDNAEALKRVVDQLRKKDCFAFDTEFIRETTFFPMIELIQVATDEESWLIDARAFMDNREGIEPLLAVFQEESILKIGHALQGDQECLYSSFGLCAHPTLDTAVAASLCGYGDNVGLANLLSRASGVTIKKGHARTNWSQRPLPKPLLEYAHMDVVYLVELANLLLGELEKRDRKDWALKLSQKWEDIENYEAQPEKLALKPFQGGRLSSDVYFVLVELYRWREKRVREINRPRKWVADDGVLIDLARVKPTSVDHLSSFRGINKGELRNSGQDILNAIEKGKSIKGELPEISKSHKSSKVDSAALQLFSCFLTELADGEKIAPRLLVSNEQKTELLVYFGKNKNTDASPDQVLEELKSLDILDKSMSKNIGEQLILFLLGKVSLSLSRGHLSVNRIKS